MKVLTLCFATALALTASLTAASHAETFGLETLDLQYAKQGSAEVWSKDLADGSKVVGLFNLGEETTDVMVTWPDLSLTGKHQVRDLWRQLDLGKSADSFQASVPRHGVVLVKISGR